MADLKQTYTIDLDLVLGALSGQKLEKEATKQAQESVDQLTKALSQIAVEPEVKVDTKLKIDGKSLKKQLSSRELIAKLREGLRGANFKASPELAQAFDQYFSDFDKSLEAVSTKSFSKTVQRRFKDIVSGKKAFGDYNEGQRQQLLEYKQALEDRLGLLKQVKAASTKINRQLVTQGEDDTKTVFNLPALVLPQLGKSIQEYGQALKDFNKLSGLAAQIRAKSAQAERDFALANIRKVKEIGGIDKAGKEFPFRRVEKAYQTLIRDKEAELKANTTAADKEKIQRDIDKLIGERDRVNARKREVLGSTLATSIENKQKSLDNNLRMAEELQGKRLVGTLSTTETAAIKKYLGTAVTSANQIQQKLAGTDKEASAKEAFLKAQKRLQDFRAELAKLGKAYGDASAHAELFYSRQRSLAEAKLSDSQRQAKTEEFARRVVTGRSPEELNAEQKDLAALGAEFKQREQEANREAVKLARAATSIENKQKSLDNNLRMAAQLRGSRLVGDLSAPEVAAIKKYLGTAVASANQVQQKLAGTEDEASAKASFLAAQKRLNEFKAELASLGKAYDTATAHVELFYSRQRLLAEAQLSDSQRQAKTEGFARQLVTGRSPEALAREQQALADLRAQFKQREEESKEAARVAQLEKRERDKQVREAQRATREAERQEREAQKRADTLYQRRGERDRIRAGRRIYKAVGVSGVGELDKDQLEFVRDYLKFAEKFRVGKQTRISNMGLPEAERTEKLRAVAAEIADISKSQRIVAQELRGNVGLARQLSTSVNSFFRYAVVYGGLYRLTGAFTTLISNAVQFKDALKGIQTVAEATDGQMIELATSIKSVASNSSFGLQEIAASAQTLAQAGVEVAKIPSALKAVSNLALATGSDLQTTADVLTSAQNIFSNQNFTQLSDQLTRTVNVSKLSADDLKTIFNLSAQTAQSSGVSSTQLLGASATLSNLGIKSSTIATGLRQLILELFNPDKQTIDFLKRRYNALGEARGEAEIKSIFQGFQKGGNPLQDAFAELRRLGVAGAARDEFRRIFDIRAENVGLPLIERPGALSSNIASLGQVGAAADGAQTRLDSLASSMKKLSNEVDMAAEMLSEDFLGMAKVFADFATRSIKGLRGRLEDRAATGADTGSSMLPATVAGAAAMVAAPFGAVGRVLTGIAAAAGAFGVSKSADSFGAVAAAATDWVITVLGILSLLKNSKVEAVNNKLKAVSGLQNLTKITGVAEGVLAMMAALGRFASLLTSPRALLAKIATRLGSLSLGPIGVVALLGETVLEVWQSFAKLDPGAQLDALRNRVARLREEADASREAFSAYDSNNSDGLAAQAQRARDALVQYQAKLEGLFTDRAGEAEALLRSLGDAGLEAGTPTATAVKTQLGDLLGRPLSEREIADLIKAQNSFAQANGTVVGMAKQFLEKASKLYEKQVKEPLTLDEKAFLSAFEQFKTSEAFTAGSSTASGFVDKASQLLSLVNGVFDRQGQQLEQQRARAEIQLSSAEVAAGVAGGRSGSTEAQIRRLLLEPTPENLSKLQNLRGTLGSLEAEAGKTGAARRAAFGGMAAPTQAGDYARFGRMIDDQMVAYQAQVADAVKAAQDKAAQDQQLDKRRAQEAEQFAAEEEAIRTRLATIEAERVSAAQRGADLEQQINDAQENRIYDSILKRGGLLDQRYELDRKELEAKRDLADFNFRKEATSKGIDPNNPQLVMSDDKVADLYRQRNDAEIAVKDLADRYADRRRSFTNSIRPGEFEKSAAFRTRERMVEDIKLQLVDQDKESLAQLEPLYAQLKQLRLANVQEEIDFLKSQEGKFKPEDRDRYRAQMDDLVDQQNKVNVEIETELTKARAKFAGKKLDLQIRALEEERKRLRMQLQDQGQSPDSLRRQTQVLTNTPPATGTEAVVPYRAAAGFTVSGNAARPGAMEGVDPRLLEVLAEAVHYTDKQVQVISAMNGRTTGTTNHPSGKAIDIQLLQDGQPLGNFQNEEAFRAYEEFWQIVKAVQSVRYPDMPFRTGLYFKGSGQRGAQGAGANMDSMHGDITSNAMGWGSWEGGASAEMRRVYPGIRSQGMGDITAFAARLEGLLPADQRNRVLQNTGTGTAAGIDTIAARLDEIDALLVDLDNQRTSVGVGGANPEELAQAAEKGATRFYEDRIKQQESGLDALRARLETARYQVEQGQALGLLSGPADTAAREAAGMANSPADELARLQRMDRFFLELQSTAVAIRELADAQLARERLALNTSLSRLASGTLSADQTKVEESKRDAAIQNIKAYEAAVREFSQAQSEATRDLATNRQAMQTYNPSLMGDSADGVKVYGQLDQVDFKNIAGKVNQLSYAFNKLGENINNFITNVIDTFVSKLAESIMNGFQSADQTAIRTARGELNDIRAEAAYQKAVKTEEIRRTQALIDQNPNGADSATLKARKAELQTALNDSIAAQNERERAAQANLQQQQDQSSMGGAFQALAKEGATTLLKTAILSPFEGIFGALSGKPDGSKSNPLYTRSADGVGQATDALGGVLGKEGEGGWFDGLSAKLGGMFDGIGNLFGDLFSSFSGLFSGGGGGGWLSGLMSLFSFAEGGVVRGPGSGTSDSIPAWLSNGEYVLTAREVQAIGVPNLERWKTAMMSPARFSSGGLVSTFDSVNRSLANSSNTNGTVGTTVVNVIDQRSTAHSAPVEASRSQGPDGKEMINIMVRDAVKNAINSGMLDRTMVANYGARRTGATR